MTIKLSIVQALPKRHANEFHFPSEEVVDWHLDLVYLRRLWEWGQDTILETAFIEIFEQLPHNN